MSRKVLPPLSAIAHAWTGHYKVKGDGRKPDCVVGFSFGFRGSSQHNTPGLSNEDLAYVVMHFHDDLPKILQHEIADAYDAMGGKDSKRIERILQPRANKYALMKQHELDTVEVAEQAKEIMAKHSWKTAVLVAQPNHMPRVQAVCSRVGVTWVSDADERGAVEFDLQSTQKWTRNLKVWRLYEPLALCYYWLRGWI